MFGGNDQPPPPPQAPLQRVETSAGTPPQSPQASATQKAAGAGQLPTVGEPGLLTDTETTKKTSGSLIGEQ